MRDGPIPVLFVAAMMAKRDEFALYEDGVFVPEVGIEVFERLLRRPGTFEVQSHKLKKAEKAALRALAAVVSTDEDPVQGFLPVVKAIVLAVAGMPQYTRRTARISTEAAAVRNALLDAQEPKQVLFEELPSALGCSVRTLKDAEIFAERLRASLVELSRTYLELLDNIEHQVRSAFGLSGTTSRARGLLRRRSEPLIPYATERRLQGFVREASRVASDRDWREVLGRVISDGLPPTHWRDLDAAQFQIKLQDVAAEYGRLEELVTERANTGAGQILRIGLLGQELRESRAFFLNRRGSRRGCGRSG